MLETIVEHPMCVWNNLLTSEPTSLEEAFRLSFIKWLLVDYLERCCDDNEFARVIGKASDTCGLCKWDDRMIEKMGYDPECDCNLWCQFCPLRDGTQICCQVFYKWVKGGARAMDVYEYIGLVWEWLLLSGVVEPFGGDVDG